MGCTLGCTHDGVLQSVTIDLSTSTKSGQGDMYAGCSSAGRVKGGGGGEDIS